MMRDSNASPRPSKLSAGSGDFGGKANAAANENLL